MYRPELDGLRAIAIALVLASHAIGAAAGGAVLPFGEGMGRAGVTAFYVLSGYLITSLLLAERERSGRIGLRGFFARRIARLAPALAVMVVIVVLLGLAGVFTSAWIAGAAATVSYTANWAMVANIDIGPFVHTWTLAIEEQFYVLWPVALIAWPRRAAEVATATLILGLALVVVLPPHIAMFSTPTNAVPVMSGCLLAIRSPSLPRSAGAFGVAILMAGGVFYVPGLAVLGTSMILASGSLALAPLAGFGKRAYSLYLWSWPLTLLLGAVGGLVVTLVAGELSYRLVETPARDAMRARLGFPKVPSNVAGALASPTEDPQTLAARTALP